MPPPGLCQSGIAANKHWKPVDGSCFYGPRSTDPFTRYQEVGPEVEIGLRPADDIVRRLSLDVAHHVDPGIDRQGRYRRVTGPPGEIGDDSRP